MAARGPEALPVRGRVDGAGRLVAAEPALERLQREAGAGVGETLALPQLAALARATRSLGVALTRSVLAADEMHDVELFVRAEPNDGDILLTIERWSVQPAAAPRLSLVAEGGREEGEGAEAKPLAFELDAALRFTTMSQPLASLLGANPDTAVGRPLTAMFRLIEEDDGAMPLLSAVAARAPVCGQRAIPRSDSGEPLLIDGEPLFDTGGQFIGFTARVRARDPADDGSGSSLEDSLDEALRSPLARIITAADHIIERGDGPLRSDYANYAGDIAAAARHLLSVIRAMGQSEGTAAAPIDLAQLARDAVGLVQPSANERGVAIVIAPQGPPCLAAGEAHAIVQILVNIIGNAVRHSPEGAAVTVSIARDGGECRVSVADQGPGIAPADQQRIFERYERVGTAPDGSGLGLAIARRLARSLGGDIRLKSAPGEGAQFSLALPAA